MIEQCCSGDLTYLLLQINVICLLLALIGTAAIRRGLPMRQLRHSHWRKGEP
jgi:hypothetical protein